MAVKETPHLSLVELRSIDTEIAGDDSPPALSRDIARDGDYDVWEM